MQNVKQLHEKNSYFFIIYKYEGSMRYDFVSVKNIDNTHLGFLTKNNWYYGFEYDRVETWIEYPVSQNLVKLVL